jgi:uncharacterized protein (DUF433 family)
MDFTPDPLPLKLDAYGTVRVSGSRITLETVLHSFLMGQSPESINEGFPTLDLGAIYSIIGHYLNHRAEFDEYLRQVDIEGEKIRRQIEARPGYAQFRERLLARKAAMPEAKLETNKG